MHLSTNKTRRFCNLITMDSALPSTANCFGKDIWLFNFETLIGYWSWSKESATPFCSIPQTEVGIKQYQKRYQTSSNAIKWYQNISNAIKLNQTLSNATLNEILFIGSQETVKIFESKWFGTNHSEMATVRNPIRNASEFAGEERNSGFLAFWPCSCLRDAHFENALETICSIIAKHFLVAHTFD